MAAGVSAFTIPGVPVAKDVAVFKAGIDVSFTENARQGFGYVGQFGDGALEHTAIARLRWTF